MASVQLCRRCGSGVLFLARSLRGFPVSRVLSSALVEPLSVPGPDGVAKVYPDKIRTIVENISQLTLLETAQLNELLKTTLNVPDTPMMPMGGYGMAVSTPQESQVSVEESEEKTEFTVRLVKYVDESKIKLIKEIKKQMEGMNLVQAKKFVEGVPQVVQADVKKEEAERLKEALEAAGGTVEID